MSSGSNAPTVQLGLAIVRDGRNAWRIEAKSPEHLAAVRVTDQAWKSFFGTEARAIEDARLAFDSRTVEFQTFLSALQQDGWPGGHGVSPIFKEDPVER